MKENPREISYYILQHAYLKKMGCDLKENNEIYTEYFPEDWFNIDLKARIEIISYALKNNLTLEESMTYYSKKWGKNI